jgi:small subunit ribosomal protein S6
MVSKEVAEKETNLEERQLRDYELVVIVSPEIEEEVLGATIDRLSQFIIGKNGTVSNIEQWGKRKLAYPIGQFMEGNYVLIRFKGKPTLNRELESSLRISEEVIRHLLIKLSS